MDTDRRDEWSGRTLGPWSGSQLDHWAFPMGGIGAGMICLEGQGSLSHVSLRHHMERFHEPFAFACLSIDRRPELTRVVEGAVPGHKIFASQGGGLGCVARTFGLPRFEKSIARSRFPFGRLDLSSDDYPISASVVGWSPFTPPNPDPSSMPVAGLEYTFCNDTDELLNGVFSFHAANFLVQQPGQQIIADSVPGHHGVSRCDRGFTLWEDGGETAPARTSAFRATVMDGDVHVNPRWFRGGWYDTQTMVWHSARDSVPIDRPDYEDDGPASPGGSLFVPLELLPGEEKKVRLLFCWHTPFSDLRYGADEAGAAGSCCSPTSDCCADHEPGERGGISQHIDSEYKKPITPASPTDCYRPWYTSQFENVAAVEEYWRQAYTSLREQSNCFADAFHDSTLPPVMLEALSANLSILKSPTVMRQDDGRFWGWEGCRDTAGCCFGNCTHVWNYAQALAHLFPELERSMRESEFGECQNALGHQIYRHPLPLRPGLHDFLAVADGQLGGVIKVYRDWRISGDSDWLRSLWPSVKASLEYCIAAWDCDRSGNLSEPHHVTYDIEFWGPESLTSGFYAAALRAAIAMAEALGESSMDYPRILDAVLSTLSERLFNGEYYEQIIEWRDKRRGPPQDLVRHPKSSPYWPEALEIMEREGPKYQYGPGCLADGVIGDWMARCAGLGAVMEESEVRGHLASVWRYNFRNDLYAQENPQRPGYALGHEAGLLLCTWPRGGEPTLPFIYSNEVWTGIEYQVAAHTVMLGDFETAEKIVAAVRSRYNGTLRNPFNEYECGHFYARALSSWALLQAVSGVRYDAVDRALVVDGPPRRDGRYFLSTGYGFGIVEWKDGIPVLDVRSGRIPLADNNT